MSLYQKASLVQIPSGYKAADAKLYSVVPNSSDGDFTVSSDADATRVNKDGLIETTVANQARLNYDPTNPQDPHLLLEPTRTNSLTYSEDFTNAAYSKQGTSSVTGNTTIAPDGSLTADTLSGATGTDVSGNVLRRNVSGTVDATLSIYVKSLGSTSFTIYIRNGSSGAVQSQSITPNGNWQRVTLTSNPNNGQIFFGNTNGDVAIWGAQLETGNYPTSYIPTTTAAVTRTADSNEIASGLGSLFNQTEGTIFLDFEYLFETTTDSSTDALRDLFTIGTATNQSDVIFIDNYRSQFRIFLVQNNVYNSLGDNSEGAVEANTRYKLAFRYKSGDSKSYLNGSLLGTNTANIDFNGTLQGIFFSENNSGRSLKNQKKVYQLMVFNEALTDAELITLTT